MEGLPRVWTVRILGPEGICGLGVMLRPRYVVTCAHVVNRALGRESSEPPLPSERIQLVPASVRGYGEPLEAGVTCWHPADTSFEQKHQDICILEIQGDDWETAPGADELLASGPRRGSSLKAFGYPGGQRPGKHSTENMVIEEVDGGWWEVHPTERGPRISPGYSGTLAWNTTEHEPVGIVVAVDKNDDIAYLIPFREVFAACRPARADAPAALPEPIPDPKGPSARRYDVFLSHSNQDAAAAEVLTDRLTAAGLDVWLDRRALVPGTSWQEELERALASASTAVILVGADGIQGVREREVRSFAEEYVRRGQPVVPVLLPGASPDDLPGFLRRHLAAAWVEGREAETTALLIEVAERFAAGNTSEIPFAQRALPRFGLWGHPNMPLPPRDYVSRPELDELARAVLDSADGKLALSGASRHFAVEGMGGVGKTVLTTMLAHRMDVRRAFPDGVLWLTMGQTPPLLELQAALRRALGDADPTSSTIEEGRVALAGLFKERACLLILDDVWSAGDVAAFDALDGSNRMLVTTRREDVSRALGAESHRIEELAPAEALSLLARSTGVAVSALPPEAKEIVRACGELPLAMTVVGGYVRRKPRSSWGHVLEQLKRVDQVGGKEAYRSLTIVLRLSVEDLDEWGERYLDLAVFPEDTGVPESVFATFWAPLGLDETAVQDVLDLFVTRSLARRDADGRIVMHDLLRDHVVAAAGATIGERHSRLLSAYRALCPGGWHTGPNDGYFFEQATWHLIGAERGPDARELVFDFRWLTARLEVSGVGGLLKDCERAGEGRDPQIELLRDTLLLASHRLASEPRELAGQLFGRLGALEDGELRRLGRTASKAISGPALAPQWPTLARPGEGLKRTLVGHMDEVTAVAFGPDGETALSGSRDGTLRLWDLDTGACVHTLCGHDRWVTCVAISPSGLTALSGALDYAVRWWDLETGELLATLKGHLFSIDRVAFGPEDGQVASHAHQTIKVWDLQTQECLRTLELGGVGGLAFTKNGKNAVVGHSGNVLDVYDLAKGERTGSLEVDPVSLVSVDTGPDPATVLLPPANGWMDLWDALTGKLLRRLDCGEERPFSRVVSPDGTRAVTYTFGRTLKMWDLSTGDVLISQRTDRWIGREPTISPDNRSLLSCSDNAVQLWDLERMAAPVDSNKHIKSVDCVACSPDGSLGVTGSADKTLKVWDLSRLEVVATLTGHQSDVTAVAIAPDGRTVLSGSADRTLKLWELPTGRELRTLQGHSDLVSSIAYHPDGATAVSGSWDGNVRFWNLRTGGQLTDESGETRRLWHTDWIKSIALDSRGEVVLTGSSDGTAKLWNFATGELVHTLRGHRQSIGAVTVTPDGSWALSGGYDHRVILWNLATGEAVGEFERSPDILRFLDLVDGGNALSAGDDKTLRLWSVKTGTEIGAFGFDDSIRSLVAHSSGRVLVGDHAGGLHVLRIV
jgi:WD40 repeat protein